MTSTRDQFYVFTMPADMCPVWAETFLSDGTHVVAPTPYSEVTDAARFLQAANPGATVDELDDPADLAEVREWARSRPLEQIGA